MGAWPDLAATALLEAGRLPLSWYSTYDVSGVPSGDCRRLDSVIRRDVRRVRRGARRITGWTPEQASESVRCQRTTGSVLSIICRDYRGYCSTMVASPILASWNQLRGWLRAVDGLRRAA